MIGFLIELSFDFFCLQEILKLRSINIEIKNIADSRYKPHLRSCSFFEKYRQINPNADLKTHKSHSHDFTTQNFLLFWDQSLPILSPYRKNLFSWFQNSNRKPIFKEKVELWEITLNLKINKLIPNDLVGVGISSEYSPKSFLGFGVDSLAFHLAQGMVCKGWNSVHYNKKVSPAKTGDTISVSVNYKTGKFLIKKNKNLIYNRSLKEEFLIKPLYFVATGTMKNSYDLDFHISVGNG